MSRKSLVKIWRSLFVSAQPHKNQTPYRGKNTIQIQCPRIQMCHSDVLGELQLHQCGLGNRNVESVFWCAYICEAIL